MKRGRPTRELFLTKAEREALMAWTRQPKCPQALALRARIILLCAEDSSNTQAAEELHLTIQTVGKWRQRFIEKRLDGLLDKPRPGTPAGTRCGCRSGDRMTMEPPNKTAHWSTRLLAEASGLSRAGVHRIWRAYSLQPHRAEALLLLKDSLND